MRRPYLIYLLAVVLPSFLTVAAGLSLAGWGWVSLRHASETRTALSADGIDLVDEDNTGCMFFSLYE